MSTGTLALAKNRRERLERVYWRNRSPEQMETCLSLSKKKQQLILDLQRAEEKLLSSLEVIKEGVRREERKKKAVRYEAASPHDNILTLLCIDFKMTRWWWWCKMETV